MKINAKLLIFGFLISVFIFLILVCLIPFLNSPRFFCTYKDFDLNSGDIRKSSFLCSLLINEKIQKTPFSRELRRLGMPVSEKRKWKRFSMKLPNVGSRTYVEYRGAGAIHTCLGLPIVFDEFEISNEKRRIVLQKALLFLQEEQYDEINKLLFEASESDQIGNNSND